MTFKEKRLYQYDYDSDCLIANHCPYSLQLEDYKDRPCANEPHNCRDCWNREIPDEKETYSMEEVKEMLDITDDYVEKVVDAINEVGNPNPMTSEDFNKALEISRKVILDSGERRQFETGAVRDIQEGKGRCDLMPLNVVGYILEDNVQVDHRGTETC